MTQIPVLVLGMLAGFLHGTTLWRSAHRLSPWSPLLGFLRLGVVTAVMLFAAIRGGIFVAAGGWAICLAATIVWVLLTAAKRSPRPDGMKSAESGNAPCI